MITNCIVLAVLVSITMIRPNEAAAVVQTKTSSTSRNISTSAGSNTTDKSNEVNMTVASTAEIAANKSGDSSNNSTGAATSSSSSSEKSSRRGRLMDFSKFFSLFKPTEEDWRELTGSVKSIQGRIMTGGGASLDELADNTFANDRVKQSDSSYHNDKYDATLIHPSSSSSSSSVKTYQPTDRYASVSYSNPSANSERISGYESSDVAPYYGGSSYSKGGGSGSDSAVLFKLVPVDHPGGGGGHSYTFTDAVKDTLLTVGGKVKDHVSGTVQKVKNALGFNGFSEKVAAPDALLAVAPVAAGLLAGGLAVAYLASKVGPRNNATSPFGNLFGKRSVRNAMSEEDLQHIVARLDPVQREYLQKLQMYGPQRWKDVTCAKYIFCDVMSRASPLHVRDMQRKVGVFLSRMEETTARYVEVILKDVMLAIQARDCSRFSCGQTTWGLPHPPQAPPPPQVIHPFQFLPGNNFLRRQRAKN